MTIVIVNEVLSMKFVCNVNISVIVFTFFLFLLLVSVSELSWQKFFASVSSFVTQEVHDQDQTYLIRHTGKCFSQFSLYCKILCMGA